ncbi:TPA: hypothetical protein ACXHSK_005229 [Klebsiella pneumoniae]
MATDPTTVREALMAELLEDVDTLIQRLEKADSTLAERVEHATADAAGKAFLSTKLSFESLIDAQAEKLTDAGRHSAALVGNQLNKGGIGLLNDLKAVQARSKRFAAMVVIAAFAAGVVGAYVGATLAAL